MPSRHLLPGLGVALSLSLNSGAAGLSPAEALRQMRVAEGFQVSLVASEPDIRQPVTMSFDERGRIWVVQYLQYPTPAGLKAVKVDQYLRTQYDRIPEPPPRGPKGADRITIGEDSDGDGVVDRFKDFTTGLNLASGLALGHGGVFVAQPPYLLFYADKNRDDVPDGDPEVLLTGFGLEDAHAFANSLQFGPDGWLYGAHGSTVTAKIRGIEFQQGLWRYHPVTREFELFAEGGGNTWGLDFNEEGEILAGTNFGEQIALHQVQGGYYVKGFAKHGPLHNAHTYGYLDHLAYRGFRGGHVTCGGIVYQGGAFPDSFQGTYLAANLLSSAIYWHRLERKGSSWQGSFGGPLLESGDSTFRPIDCLTGPDGALYVVDWCDLRASHVDPVDNWDKSNGRIYRVQTTSAGHGGKSPKFDLARFSTTELIHQLTNSNDWFRRMARQQLAERRDPAALPRLTAQCRQTTNGPLALQSLWTLAASGELPASLATTLLQHPHPPVRAWTVRWLGDRKQLSADLVPAVATLARTEKSAAVRAQLACSAKRWPAEPALAVLRELMRHAEDVNDPQLPLLLWWALEEKIGQNPDQGIQLLLTADDWREPMVRTHLLERLARRYASLEDSKAQPHAAWLLRTAPNNDLREIVLRGFDKAWEGPRPSNRPAIRQALEKIWSPDQPLMLKVGLRLGLARAEAEALHRLSRSETTEAEKLGLVEVLGQCGVTSAPPRLLELLQAPPRLQTATIAALQNFEDETIAITLREHLPRLSPEGRARARAALASRPSWARQLLHAVAAGTVADRDITQDQLRQMLRFNVPDLTAAIEKRWGRLQPQSDAEKTSTINRLKLVLNPSGTTLRFAGDAEAGRPLFTRLCAACHSLFGAGAAIGPELTGADRKNSEWLLGQIVDPSAFIRPEYVNHNLEMKDGRTLGGLVLEQSDTALTILDAQGQRTVVNRSEVKDLNASATSLMPEGLLESLSPQEVRDLFAYLQRQP